MRRVMFLGIIALAAVALAGCSTSNSPTTYHVYISGTVGTTSPSMTGYWKDGAAMTSIGLPAGSVLQHLIISGSTTYVAGYDGSGNPVYWTNGTATALPLPGGYTTFNYFNGIAVVGSMVYVVGNVSPGNVPVLWTNGNPTVLPLGGDTSAYVSGVVASGSSLYILGGTNGSPGHPVYWDGAAAIHQLPQGTAAGGWNNGRGVTPIAITVSGSDVYMVGTTYTSNNTGPGTPIVWKNGAILWTGATSTTNYMASGIAVSGSDVYVVGEVDEFPTAAGPVYWKNGGNAIPLSTSGLSSSNAVALGIAVAGSNVYIFGEPAVYSATDPLTPIVWINSGSPTYLTWPNSDPNAQVQGIAASGSDIWIEGSTGTAVSGQLNYSGITHVLAWKNGTAMALTNPAGYLYGGTSNMFVLRE